MRFFAAVITISTLTEVYLLGVGLELITLLIARILMLLKLLGLDIKVKWVVILEAATLFIYLTYTFLFRNPLDWWSILYMVGFFAFLMLMQMWDSYHYIYAEGDYTEEER